MTEHRTWVSPNPHGTRFRWVCGCGERGKRKHFAGYAERDGQQHVKDKASK